MINWTVWRLLFNIFICSAIVEFINDFFMLSLLEIVRLLLIFDKWTFHQALPLNLTWFLIDDMKNNRLYEFNININFITFNRVWNKLVNMSDSNLIIF